MFAVGSLIVQSRPSNTDVQPVFQAVLDTEIGLMLVANTTGNAALFRLFHANNNTTFDESTALFWDVNVASNSVFTFASQAVGSGIQLSAGGGIAIRSSVANALTFNIYGATQNAAESTRR